MKDWIGSAPRTAVDEFLSGLSDNALMALPWLFEFWALDHQKPPEGEWKTWVVLGGRGAGKTRAGAEWVRSQVEGSGPFDPGQARRVALVGDTLDQVRDVMVFGESGIVAVCPEDRKPVWEAARRRLVWPNGAIAQAFSAHDPEGLRGPQFDAAWADEIGCPAVDKGTNEPNKFVDPKSSESSLPFASTGRRDDLVQMQYLRAVTSYWDDPERNPHSTLYDGRMVDTARAFVWAWDTRPYPEFPRDSATWSDADNYRFGHWISGRTSAQPLASVVAEISNSAGLTDLRTEELFGLVRGYAVAEAATGRAALQPLMVAFGFDASETGGDLRFRMRGLGTDLPLSADDLAEDEATGRQVERVRSGDDEVPGRVRLTYVEAEGDFATRTAEMIFPGAGQAPVASSETALSLLTTEAQGIAERWLAEVRLSRETVRFALPPSFSDVEAGDPVSLPFPEGRRTYRLERIELAGAVSVEASRYERSVQVPSDNVFDDATVPPFAAPVPVFPVFLDLPLMTGQEIPHAPHLAVAATPWPGSVAVYSSDRDDGYSLNRTIALPSAIGVTETPLLRAQAGIWDRGEALRVRFETGQPGSVDRLRLLNGANLIAIGDGTSDGWELVQFQTSVAVAPGVFDLSVRLRGQAGTEVSGAAGWPAGSTVVLIDGSPQQITLALSERDLARHYRIGPARLGPADPVFVHRVEAFAGVGLRPLAPVHLRSHGMASGEIVFSWIRRTRIGGDAWSGADVPLGETRESYLVRVLAPGGTILRESETNSPVWTYLPADQAADGLGAAFDLAVAQVSDVYGPGPFARITVDV